ncbi:MAG: hypothetical protein ACFFD4_15955 [Candidatus Odinarchaeota archaeon]
MKKKYSISIVGGLLILLTAQVLLANELLIFDRFGFQYYLTEERQIQLENYLPGYFSRVEPDVIPNVVIGSAYYTILHNNSPAIGSTFSTEQNSYFVRADFNDDFTEMTSISFQMFPYDNSSWWGCGLGYNGTYFWTAGYIEGSGIQLLCFSRDLQYTMNYSLPIEGFYSMGTWFHDIVVIDNDLWIVHHNHRYEGDWPDGKVVYNTSLIQVNLQTLEIINAFEIPVGGMYTQDGVIGYLKDVHVDGSNLWLIVAENVYLRKNIKFYKFSLDENRIEATIHNYEHTYFWKRENFEFHNGHGATVSGDKIIEPLFGWNDKIRDVELRGFAIWSYKPPLFNVIVLFWFASTGIFACIVIPNVKRTKIALFRGSR